MENYIPSNFVLHGKKLNPIEKAGELRKLDRVIERKPYKEEVVVVTKIVVVREEKVVGIIRGNKEPLNSILIQFGDLLKKNGIQLTKMWDMMGGDYNGDDSTYLQLGNKINKRGSSGAYPLPRRFKMLTSKLNNLKKEFTKFLVEHDKFIAGVESKIIYREYVRGAMKNLIDKIDEIGFTNIAICEVVGKYNNWYSAVKITFREKTATKSAWMPIEDAILIMKHLINFCDEIERISGEYIEAYDLV